jgi:hypothetical protein
MTRRLSGGALNASIGRNEVLLMVRPLSKSWSSARLADPAFPAAWLRA